MRTKIKGIYDIYIRISFKWQIFYKAQGFLKRDITDSILQTQILGSRIEWMDGML